MATEPDQSGKAPKTERQLEQEALVALRAHRQQSGHVPWNHDDNAQLQAIHASQQHQQQQAQAITQGIGVYQRRTVKSAPPAIATVANHLPHVQVAAEETEPGPLVVRGDPELARIALGLNRSGELLLWLVARHYFGDPGWAQRNELFDTLKAAGVVNTRRNFNRTLKKGRGVFWNASGDRVYLRSYIKVSARLTEAALAAKPDLVATNIPGVRDVYLQVAGDLGDFKAQIYAGWLAHRQDPKIARETLCRLFACSKDTLRSWEARLEGNIEVAANYAQTSIDPRQDEQIADYIPAHSYCYVTRRGQIRIRWQQPNTYKTKNIHQHHYKGQSRKARTAAARVAWFQPVETWAAAPAKTVAFDRSHREPRRYFESQKQLKRYLRRLEKKGEVGISPQTPRYLFRGRNRYEHGIWELSLDGEAYTTAWERMTIKAEYRWWAGFKARRQQMKTG